jgi:hypothetical protein
MLTDARIAELMGWSANPARVRAVAQAAAYWRGTA